MQRAIELNPDNAPALNYLGYTYAEQGVRLDEAENLIRRALAIRPTTASTSTASAGCTSSAANTTSAIEHLERATTLAADDPTIAEHLGDAYRQVGRSVDALRVYRDALSRSTEVDQAERLRGKIEELQALGVSRKDS